MTSQSCIFFFKSDHPTPPYFSSGSLTRARTGSDERNEGEAGSFPECEHGVGVESVVVPEDEGDKSSAGTGVGAEDYGFEGGEGG